MNRSSEYRVLCAYPEEISLHAKYVQSYSFSAFKTDPAMHQAIPFWTRAGKFFALQDFRRYSQASNTRQMSFPPFSSLFLIPGINTDKYRHPHRPTPTKSFLRSPRDKKPTESYLDSISKQLPLHSIPVNTPGIDKGHPLLAPGKLTNGEAVDVGLWQRNQEPTHACVCVHSRAHVCMCMKERSTDLHGRLSRTDMAT